MHVAKHTWKISKPQTFIVRCLMNPNTAVYTSTNWVWHFPSKTANTSSCYQTTYDTNPINSFVHVQHNFKWEKLAVSHAQAKMQWENTISRKYNILRKPWVITKKKFLIWMRYYELTASKWMESLLAWQFKIKITDYLIISPSKLIYIVTYNWLN